MAEAYEVECWEWTQADFERMGWHDATIRAIAYLPDTWELVLDIDYILQWMAPEAPDEYYRFWIAPATLVFENASSIRIGLELNGEITMQALERGEPESTRDGYEGPNTQWPWTVDCNEGEITLRATGFRQFIRRPPVLSPQQTLAIPERGGFSFARGIDSDVRDRAADVSRCAAPDGRVNDLLASLAFMYSPAGELKRYGSTGLLCLAGAVCNFHP